MNRVEKALTDYYQHEIEVTENKMRTTLAHSFSASFRHKADALLKGQMCKHTFSARSNYETAGVAALSAEPATEERNVRRHRFSFKFALLVGLLLGMLLYSSIVIYSDMPAVKYMVLKTRGDYTDLFFRIPQADMDAPLVPAEAHPPQGFYERDRGEGALVFSQVFHSYRDPSIEIALNQTKITEKYRASVRGKPDQMDIFSWRKTDVIQSKLNDTYVLQWVQDGCFFTLTGNCSLTDLREVQNSIPE